MPQRVPGHLLSCYTTSVAAYLAALGMDPLVPLASQWFLELHGGDDPSSLELRHYHTPLLGDGSCYQIELRAERAAAAADAHERIAEEVRRRGAAIVLADTARLPWLVTCGKSSAPHWIVVDAVDEHGALHVGDRFEWTDEAGEQTAYEGWLAAADVARLGCAPALERDARFRARERWAFGAARAPPEPPRGDATTWRWFTCTGQARGAEDASALADRLVARSCSAASASTSCGALERLAEILDAALDSPAAFELGNDLWVIGRTRMLFLERLAASPPSWADAAEVRSLAADLGGGVASVWQSVSRAMYYDSMMVAGGRPPRRAVVKALREAAALERTVLAALTDLDARIPAQADA